MDNYIESHEYDDKRVKCKLTTLIGEDNIMHAFLDIAIDLEQINDKSEIEDILNKIQEAMGYERN